MRFKIIFLCLVAVVTLTQTQLYAQAKPEGLFLNSKAPDFKGKDQNGAEFKLKDTRKKGPVVLIFYRGYWCPYCNKALSRFQDSLTLLQQAGATVIAVTPETAQSVQKTAGKTAVAFPVITDADQKIMQQYGVAFKVDEKTVGKYKNFDIDLATINGQPAGNIQLPVPAVYVIDKEGYITYRFFEEDYKKRPWVKDVLKALK